MAQAEFEHLSFQSLRLAACSTALWGFKLPLRTRWIRTGSGNGQVYARYAEGTNSAMDLHPSIFTFTGGSVPPEDRV
jgi:hypothetical protein